ncbi:NAD(P)/FAD-dependent oxidoreductase [Microbacterium atlanticum]|uniref:NAD(P)/FAD-dependent oxidoreductase n=1 Tax=Microbacterium atlanticum TaxID=2782168 RepID=UPI00188880E9|nr:FAD-dependent oxidoreductase [Microbacterium atlanticum]
MTVSSIAIVGASLTGTRAAEALRSQGYDGAIHLIGGESHEPYERPPLSKRVLLESTAHADLALRQEWDSLALDLITDEHVVELDTPGRRVVMQSGREVIADRVLLATGGAARDLQAPGERLTGVHSVRDLEDAHALRAELHAAENVVIIGNGFIGLEVAASARACGANVTVVSLTRIPMERSLGARWGTLIGRRHEREGVVMRTGVGIAELHGTSRVTAVALDDGTVLPADLVIVGVGMTPRTELAEQIGLTVAGGIVVDALGATSNPAIFAAGDVAVQPAWRGEGLVRYESFHNAEQQGAAVAAAMLGCPAPVREVPWFWSDQFDMNIQVTGEVQSEAEIILRGDPDSDAFSAFHVSDGRLVGAFAINQGRDVRGAMSLIAADVAVSTEALADPSVDLRRLARSSR